VYKIHKKFPQVIDHEWSVKIDNTHFTTTQINNSIVYRNEDH
jgi:hypothetical protein